MAKRHTTIRNQIRRQVRKGRPPCWICGTPIDYDADWLDPNSFTIDHVIALDAGGPDTLANTKPAHRGCNLAKSNKPYAPGILRRSGALKL